MNIPCAVQMARCWLTTRRVIRAHPKVFHTSYAVSHVAYLALVAIEGHGWYAIAAIPAALAYGCTFICMGKEPEHHG